MNKRLEELFDNEDTIALIKAKLPLSFQLAEIDCSRAGKVGMEVGSVRETILISFLIHIFGKENVDTEIPITKSEADVSLYNLPLSIKTKTGRDYGGIKAVWTVDAISAKSFKKTFSPHIDLLFAQINWNQVGLLSFIPYEAQLDIFKTIGVDQYLKLPKSGTNPRGVEYSRVAIESLIKHQYTKNIKIYWFKSDISYNKYQRWVDFWNDT